MMDPKYIKLLLMLSFSSAALCIPSPTSKEKTGKTIDNELVDKKSSDCTEPTLHKLVRNGDSVGLSKYFADGGDLYQKDCNLRTALHVAIAESNNEIVRDLLEVESNKTKATSDERSILMSSKDSNGITPMMLAIEKDDTDIATELADGGFDVTDRLESDNSSLVHFAAVKGSADSIRWLVERGLDVNGTDKDRNWIPLHHAAFHGKLQAAKALLELGSCFSCKDKWGFTSLARAIQQGHPDVAEVIVKAGADINECSEPKNTLLHFAASAGQPKSIQWLISKGLNVNATDEYRQWTPLHHAIFHAKLQAAKMLLLMKSCYNCKDKWGFTPLMRAIEKDDVAIAKVLVQSGADIHQRLQPDNMTLLHLAAGNGGIDSIRWLVKQGLRVNDTDDNRQWIPLHHAIFHGKYPAVKVLLVLKSCTSCSDKWGFTPLMRTVQRDDVAMITTLVQSGADLDQHLETNSINLLHFAAANGSMDSIRFLVKKGFNVNETDGIREWNPLHHAIFHGQLAAVKLLLELNCCNTCKDKWGYTPLMRAVQRDDVALITALAQSGADLKQRLLLEQATLVHFAASSDSTDSIRWLVGHGLDVNSLDEKRNRLPLHYAASKGKLHASKVLVSLGCCINCRDSEGATPLLLAKKHNHHSVVEYLKSVDGKE